MQISTIRSILLASVAVGALAACEGTTTSNGENGENGENGDNVYSGDVTTGTTDGSGDGSNGLPFADGGSINPGDLNETELTLRAARLVIDDDADDVVTAELIDLDIINYGYNEGVLVVTIDMGGVTMLLDWQQDNCAVASDGIEYCVKWNQNSAYTTNIIIAESDNHGDFSHYHDVLVGAFAGFETDPDLLEYKGMATYSGGFEIEVVVGDDDITDDVEGTINIAADFGGATITGDLDDNSYDGWDVDFAGVIAGNGWTAENTTSEIFDGDLAISDGSIQLDGVFYGPTGDETAGTIIVDVEVSDTAEIEPNDPFYVTGVGGFLAWEDTL